MGHRRDGDALGGAEAQRLRRPALGAFQFLDEFAHSNAPILSARPALCYPTLAIERPLRNFRPDFVGGNPDARKRLHPPLPIRGEDAANAAGEGTGVGRGAPNEKGRRQGRPRAESPSP